MRLRLVFIRLFGMSTRSAFLKFDNTDEDLEEIQHDKI
ncbi:UNVERIFIED_CONTAM: hypothetical protein ABIC26_001912 [Paenibacillus sp. PvR008]